MKKIFLLIALSLLFTNCISVKSNLTATAVKQNNLQSEITQKRPKLVVGIVVDQMRYDYLVKFYNKFGQGGVLY